MTDENLCYALLPQSGNSARCRPGVPLFRSLVPDGDVRTFERIQWHYVSDGSICLTPVYGLYSPSDVVWGDNWGRMLSLPYPEWPRKALAAALTLLQYEVFYSLDWAETGDGLNEDEAYEYWLQSRYDLSPLDSQFPRPGPVMMLRRGSSGRFA